MSIFTSLNYQHGYSSCYCNCKICFSHLMNFIFINFVFQEKSNSHGFKFVSAKERTAYSEGKPIFESNLFLSTTVKIKREKEMGRGLQNSFFPPLPEDRLFLNYWKTYGDLRSWSDSESSEDFRGWPEGLYEVFQSYPELVSRRTQELSSLPFRIVIVRSTELCS